MISAVLFLFKGESPEAIAGDIPDKVKSLKKIQTLLHLIRAILLLLGVTLVILGLIGVIGLPGLVAGGVLLLIACSLIVPLFIRSVKKFIKSKQPISIFTQTWIEFEDRMQKWENIAPADPEISKIWACLKARANQAVNKCRVQEWSEEFYIPLMFWGVAEVMEDQRYIPSELCASWKLMEMQSYYLLIMQGLKHFDKLMTISKNEVLREIQEERRRYGECYSIESIVLCLDRRCFGLQVIRGGLALLYQSYITMRKSDSGSADIDKMRPLYNDVIKQCTKKFPLKEIERLTKLKQRDGRVSEICHGDLIYKMLSQLDDGLHFPALNLVNPNIHRGSNYDCLWA